MLKSKSEQVEFRENINVVIIQILEEKYLLEVENIKEIYVPGEAIVPVPLTEKSIVGIINIRGDIYSIISLRHNIYGNGIEYGMDEYSRILLLEYRDLKIAVLVDAVIGVRDIPLAVFKKQGTIVKTNIDFRLIKLTGVFQDESLILLDLDALIQPYIKSMGRKIEKKVELKPKVLERPKVQPKLTIEPKIDSTVVIPQEVTVPKKKKKSIKKLKIDKQVVLTNEQQDTLKEIGNIGTGNAVTALSRLVKKKIDVTLTDVGIVPLDDLPEQFGGSKDKVCGIFCHIEKPSPATILNIFEMKPLMNLISELAGPDSNIEPSKVKKKSDLDDYAISTITEMGNIMAGHYASALADLLDT
ncbi:MAG: chemotaxis protein CheC, partial [Promethearchaeota archaeon]